MSSYELLIKNKIVEYEATPNYGLITEKSSTLDDYETFKEFLIGYHLYKIKCWSENETGIKFDWQRLDDKKASRLIYRIPGLNFDNHSNLLAKMINSYAEETLSQKNKEKDYNDNYNDNEKHKLINNVQLKKILNDAFINTSKNIFHDT